jgi:hypothetical protein
MSSPSNATKWMSYLAEGFLAEEEVQPSTPFFWCNGQQPVGQVDCRYLLTSFFRVLLTDDDLRPMQVADYWGTAETSVLIDIFSWRYSEETVARTPYHTYMHTCHDLRISSFSSYNLVLGAWLVHSSLHFRLGFAHILAIERALSQRRVLQKYLDIMKS